MVHEYENNLIAAPRYVENTVDSSSGSEVDAESVEEETKTNTAEAIPIEEAKPAADPKYEITKIENHHMQKKNKHS